MIYAAPGERVGRASTVPDRDDGGILVLVVCINPSDEQMEYQLLDPMSFKRFCGLANATNVPDRTTAWTSRTGSAKRAPRRS